MCHPTWVWGIQVRDLVRPGQILTTIMIPISISYAAENPIAYIATTVRGSQISRQHWVLAIPAMVARGYGGMWMAMGISIFTSPTLANPIAYIAMTVRDSQILPLLWGLTTLEMGMARPGQIMTAMGISTSMSLILARTAFTRTMAMVFPSVPIVWA